MYSPINDLRVVIIISLLSLDMIFFSSSYSMGSDSKSPHSLNTPSFDFISYFFLSFSIYCINFVAPPKTIGRPPVAKGQVFPSVQLFGCLFFF